MRNVQIAKAQITGLIASKDPIWTLVQTVDSLFKGGASRVIVVDDGSTDPDSLLVFERVAEMGAEVLHLSKNVGKAAALGQGFRAISFGDIIVQTDDDTLSGDLSIPLAMLAKSKADIIDIRVESNHTQTVLGMLQELSYWMVNFFVKRLHNILRARLWMSGASIMYTYTAGKILLMEESMTATEDTEGLFRARKRGLSVRYCSKKASQFTTMVPEDFPSLRRQWKRWSLGGAQVLGIYGLGGGRKMVAVVNLFAWFIVVVEPFPVMAYMGLEYTLEWIFGFAILCGIAGAICLRRPKLAFIGILLPLMCELWAFCVVEGLVAAIKQPLSVNNLTWKSPKRTSF